LKRSVAAAAGASSQSASRGSTRGIIQQPDRPESVSPTHGVVGGRLGVEDERDDKAVETQHLGENEDEDLCGVSADDDDDEDESVDPHLTIIDATGHGTKDTSYVTIPKIHSLHQRKCLLRKGWIGGPVVSRNHMMEKSKPPHSPYRRTDGAAGPYPSHRHHRRYRWRSPRRDRRDRPRDRRRAG
jgi:hypothetical protein